MRHLYRSILEREGRQEFWEEGHLVLVEDWQRISFQNVCVGSI
jgi:hypothetical protein